MKRLILVSVLLVMLPVLARSPALNAPSIDSTIPCDAIPVSDAETVRPSGNSTITITMTGVDG